LRNPLANKTYKLKIP